MNSKGNHPSARLIHAVHFAADKHRDQRRKDHASSPYINHPVEVAQVLAEVGSISDTATLLAAVLHDTVEDTETTLDELEETFGPEVSDLVAEVTDDKLLPKEERKRLQIHHAPTLTERAKLIKLADKICNVRDVTHNAPKGWSLARRQEYLEWARSVVEGCRGASRELERYFDEVYVRGRAALVAETDA